MKKVEFLKTASMMAKKNDLTLVKKDKTSYLYDFSQLEKIPMMQEYIDGIKEVVMHDTSTLNRMTFISLYNDQFTGISGNIYMKYISVYDASGKRKYVYMDVSAIDIRKNERQNIYGEYHCTEHIQEKYYCNNEIEHVEIAC